MNNAPNALNHHRSRGRLGEDSANAGPKGRDERERASQYLSAQSQTPTYDTRGNLTGFAGWTHTYDSKNRLLNTTNGTSSVATTFDFRNRAVSRTINGVTTYFVCDDWSLIEERDASGTLIQKYIQGPGIDNLLAKTNGTGTVYYHQDGLGSTVALTDASGAVVENYTYDAFGAPKVYDVSGLPISVSGCENRFLFTGREFITEVGFYDYRNRAYDAELGRFLQTDPIRFEAGDGNLYRYVSNRPVNLNDPLGLEKCETSKDVGNYKEEKRKVTPTRPGQDPDSKQAEKAAKKLLPPHIRNALTAGEFGTQGGLELITSIGAQFELWLKLSYVCCICKDDGSVGWSETRNAQETAMTDQSGVLGGPI
jgi:RHS repeat-associated protein